MTGHVYAAKGWKWDRDIQPADREKIFERLLLLPAWAQNQLEAAHLDVKKLERWQGFYRLRVGRFRAVFQKFAEHVVVHRVDSRDDAYEDASLEALTLVRSGDGLRVLREPEPAPEREVEQRRPPVRRRAAREVVQNPLSPLEHRWLEQIGLSEDAIDALRRTPSDLVPEEPLLRLGIDRELVALVADMWERPALYVELFASGQEVKPELALIDEEEGAKRIGAGLSATSLLVVRDAESLAALLDLPIEDWMVYLHPAQLRPVTLSRDGPARVRGGAGTGKTVVALHRARRLAESVEGPVLLTTFIRNLPKVWRGLFGTFGRHVRDQIDMRHLDSVAMGIYRDGGGTCEPAEDGQRSALIRELHGPARARIGGLSTFGLREEFDYMLTGRSVRSLEQYQALPRSGRGSPLSAAARQTVWALYERYCQKMEHEGLLGWDEIRREALEMLLDGRARKRYEAVVVDEAQDLTETGMRLLIELAGGLPSPPLTIVGDGQQSIYPGGFSLRSIGVDVRGRSSVLRTNWRNTYGIWMAAQAFIAGERFDDLEDDDELLRGEQETPYPLRDGDPVRLHVVRGGLDAEAEWAAELVADDIRAGSDPGDCAIVVPSKVGVDALGAALRELRVPVAPLEKYEGEHRPRVWLGTFHRAKGLEFKHVYVCGLSGSRWPYLPRELDEIAREEERARQIRAAFVAMTRARDHLDVVCAEPLPPELERARWAFDE